MNKPYSNKALPAGTVLREWRLEEVLGVGGFGIVYKGRGIYFDELVAIKEYFPSSISERDADDTVVPIDSDAEEVHALGLKKFVEEAKLLACLGAQAAGCGLAVSDVDTNLAIDVDRDLMLGAVGNLVQNAFKFTRPGSEVNLDAYAIGDRIHIDVRDHCGGLPAGEGDRLFELFHQSGDDRTGLGLGLSIARRSVEANQGVLRVRDLPGTGCVFTIDLPRHALV